MLQITEEFLKVVEERLAANARAEATEAKLAAALKALAAYRREYRNHFDRVRADPDGEDFGAHLEFCDADHEAGKLLS
jgi:hypothetical protein